MDIPTDRHYTEEHEWVLPMDDGKFRIGITDYAQDALGDVVFVELPEVGATFEANATMAEVESTKSVAEVYAPLAGSVVEVNQALIENPGLINQAPYGDGWFAVIEATDPSAVGDMLDAAAYATLTE